MQAFDHEEIKPWHRIVMGLGAVFLGSWLAGIIDHCALIGFPTLSCVLNGYVLGFFCVLILSIPVAAIMVTVSQKHVKVVAIVIGVVSILLSLRLLFVMRQGASC